MLSLATGLGKTQIGEYLGEGDQFNIVTMHAYVNRLDFTARTFDRLDYSLRLC